MSDEPKSLFDLLYKTVKSSIPRSKLDFTYNEFEDDVSGAKSARDLLAGIAS